MGKNRDVTFALEHDDQVLAATDTEQIVTWDAPVTFFTVYNVSGQVCIYEPDVVILDADSFRIPNGVIRDEPIRCTTVCIKLDSGTGSVYLRGYR